MAERLSGPADVRSDVASGGLALLDGASALLAALVGLFFFRVWRKSRLGLDLLLTCSFAFLGIAFGLSFTEDLLGFEAETVGYPRFSLELAGATTLVAAYVSARAKVNAGPALLVGWGIAGVGMLFVLAYVLIPPALTLTPVAQVSPYANTALGVLWGCCAGFASVAWARRRIPTRATVALGYLALGLSYYTWTLVELGQNDALLIVAYVWRLAGLVLVGLAVVLPPRGGAPDAGAA